MPGNRLDQKQPELAQSYYVFKTEEEVEIFKILHKRMDENGFQIEHYGNRKPAIHNLGGTPV
jgi:hypothetical protein